MPTRRSLKLTTNDDDSIKVNHSQKTGEITISMEDAEGGIEYELSISPRQSDILLYWFKRLNDKLAA